jgi:hypothetical protein
MFLTKPLLLFLYRVLSRLLLSLTLVAKGLGQLAMIALRYVWVLFAFVYILLPALLLTVPTFCNIVSSLTKDLMMLTWSINDVLNHLINILIIEDDKLDWGDRASYLASNASVYFILLGFIKIVKGDKQMVSSPQHA